ncbi:hypothetical protein N9164_03695 [Draconibacterium sp.]|nr:hypothetical protein [Draconibacterium sp.]
MKEEWMTFDIISKWLIAKRSAVLSGAFFVWQTGLTTLYLMLDGLFFLLFYTWPLKYICHNRVGICAGPNFRAIWQAHRQTKRRQKETHFYLARNFG